MIYFLCPIPDSPSGGVEKIYQFAEAIQTHGACAAVVHRRQTKPAMWFETRAKVLLSHQVRFNPTIESERSTLRQESEVIDAFNSFTEGFQANGSGKVWPLDYALPIGSKFHRIRRSSYLVKEAAKALNPGSKI